MGETMGERRIARWAVAAAGTAVLATVVAAGAAPAGAAPAADLSVTMSRTPSVAQALVDTVRYTAVVTNTGPDAAQNVALVDPVGYSSLIQDAATTQGSCDTENRRQAVCTIGTLADGASATVTIDVVHAESGLVTNSVGVTTGTADPDAGNDIATVSTVVTEPPLFEEFIVRGYLSEVLLIDPTDEQVDRWTEELYEYGRPEDFALELLKSYTFRSNFVNETYEKLLGRSADEAGLAIFTRALSQGATYEDVKVTLAGSSEYYRKAGGGPGLFARKLVRDVTGREPSASLKASLVQQLADGGSRTQVADRIVRSHLGRGAWIRGQYRRYYGREAWNYEQSNAVSQLFGGQRPARVLSKLLGDFEYYEHFYPEYYWDYSRPANAT
jgi:uncharacterized repeat protein (TIGR01451 family)